MRYLSLLAFCLPALTANAQDWKPVRSGPVYNYLLNGDKNSIRSLWIDSSKSVGGENVDYLNRVYTYPVIATLSDGSFCENCAVVNQPQFLLKSVRETSEGYLFEDGQHSFLIKPRAALNESWPFDDNTTATVTDISFGQVLSANDSLKTVTLSTGEKIVISKEYGIISFPVPGSKDQYEVAGIEGVGIGIRVPNAKSIYGFGIGDKFEYHGQIPGRTYEDRAKYYPTIDQYTILSRKDENDQITYLVKGIYQENGQTPKEYTKKLTFNLDINWLNAYPYQYLNHTGELMEWVDIRFDADLGLYTRRNGMDGKPDLERYKNTDTFAPPKWVACGYGETICAPNLGITSYRMYGISYYEGRELVAHSGEVANFGTFTNFSLSTGPDAAKTASIDIFPNPVSDRLIVTFKNSLSEPVKLTLCNTAGVIVCRYSSDSEPDQTAELDVSGLPAGMYILSFSTQGKASQEKVFVRR